MERSLPPSLFAACAITVIAGCATLEPDDYAYSDARVEQSVAYGIVESVKAVRLNEDHAPVGTIAGAALGGILGNDIGHGLGRAAATVAGAVAGGIGGNDIEHRLTQGNGEEIVVRLNDGRLVAITQGGNAIAVGERVRVLSGPKGSRVEPA